jgi:hypothetical protein
LTYKNVSGVEKFNINGVHQLTCPECGKEYPGQTGVHSTSDVMSIFNISNIGN